MVLVLVLPLAVIPWGEGEGYTQAKALTLYALTVLAVSGWVLARLGPSGLRWRLTPAELPVWGYVLALLLSTVVSSNLYNSFLGTPLRREGLFTHLAYVGLYFIGVHFFGCAAGLRTLATAAGASALVAIGYGLVQLAVPPLFPAEAFMREWYGGLGVPRLGSLVGGPVVFGGYLATVVPLLLALGVSSPSRIRALWLAGAVLGCVATGLTLTRAAWLALIAGMVVLVVAVWERRTARIVTMAIATAAVLSVGVLLVAAGPHKAAARATSTVDLSSGSAAQRLYTWKGTVQLVRTRPWLGWGLETLGEVFPYDRRTMVPLFGHRPVIIDRAHNDLLHVAVSVGAPGAMSYAAFWGLVVYSAWRLVRRAEGSDQPLAAGWLAAVVAYLLQAQFSFSTVAVTPLVWLLAGSACGWEAGIGPGRIAGTRERGNAK